MAKFDPVEFLKSTEKPSSGDFNPDTFLKETAPALSEPALTPQQRYRQTLKAYHEQGTENPDVAPGYVSPETSKAFAEDKANIPQLGAEWGDVGTGALKGMAGGVFGGVVGDVESLGRLPFQIPGVREYIADVSPHTVIPTSEEGGYLGPRGLGAFNAPENAREKAGALIGSMLSPNVLSGFYKGASTVAKGMAGQATFVGPLALETAYNAGYKGGESAKAFRESITKTAKLDEVVQEAKYSIANMREAKNADYAANMEKLSKDPTILNFDEIDKSIAAATQIDTFHGKVLLPLSDEVRKKMNGVIREWRAEDPAIFHTPAGFDALKKSLGGILEKTERGSTENKAALEIYNAVRKTIVDQAPEYASIMKAYEKSSDTIRELESTFSIKNSFKRGASQDTALRKLQTILRDNVNASYGNREQLAQYLIANGSPNLMEKLAGQALNPYSPRGLGKLSMSIGAQMAAIAAGSLGGVPLATFVGGLALSSPRLMGNIAYLNGVIARYGNKVPAGTAARLGAAAGVEDEPPRATGGSVFDKMHMARKRAEGGGTDVPFNEWDAVPRNAEGIPQIRIEKTQADEARTLANMLGGPEGEDAAFWNLLRNRNQRQGWGEDRSPDQPVSPRDTSAPHVAGRDEMSASPVDRSQVNPFLQAITPLLKSGPFKDAATATSKVRGVAGKIADDVVGAPSRAMKPTGYPEGSEEADFLNAGKRRDAMYWGPDMALNMVGIGGPLAMMNAGKNTIGIAGGRGVKAALPAVSIKKLERSLDRSGVRVDESKGSNLSSSAYLEATIPDWSGYKIGPLPEDATRTVKVRAADHDLPPTYKNMNGRADIEIGPHGDAAGSWHDAASYIFKEGGIRPDPITKRVLNAEFAKRDAAQSARAVAEEARAAEGAHAASRADDAWRGILREHGIPETFERGHDVYNTKTMRRQLEQWKKSAATDANSEFGKRYNPFVRYGITNKGSGKLLGSGTKDKTTGKAVGAEQLANALEQPNAPTFYSALDRAVADIPQTKASAEQWAATLANRPGVKPEEIQWRGLDQYLAGRQGQTVTKQEIAAHLAGNKVELGSVVKGGAVEVSPQMRTWLQDEVRPSTPEEWMALSDRLERHARHAPTSEIRNRSFSLAEEAGQHAEGLNINTGSTVGMPKYGQYQLPGGENYSEKLLTLPGKTDTTKLPDGYRLEPSLLNGNKRVEVYGPGSGRYASGDTPEQAIASFHRQHPAAGSYKSSHWDEPNPVTHMRTNERTIGNTASHHIEEVQSDWHQKGRDAGYRGEPTDKAVEEKASSGFDQAWRGGGKSWETAAEDERKIWRENTRARMIEKGDGVPDAPFKKTWPDLTMKQALRDAVEGGFDRLSWTPGEAQALRYPDELRKSVSSIEWHNMKSEKPNPTGEKQILVEHKQGGGQTEFTVNKDGVVTAGPGQAVGKPINEVIGKDMSRQIMEQPTGSIDGKDFVMGAHGMTEFYDKMLPKAVEKLGKAYGVKVQRGVDTTGNPVNYVDIPPAWKQEILKKGFSLFAAGGSVFDKMQEAKHMQEGGGLSSFLEGEYSGNKQGQHGWGYLGIESPTWSAGIGGQGWRANTPEGPLGRASITNVDVGHKKGDLNLKGSYSANQREIAGPSSGGNPYFDPIDYPGQKFSMPNDIDKRFMLRLSKPFSDGGSVFDKMQNGGVPLPTPSPRMENYNAANVEMDLTPEEQALYQRHLSNLYGTGGVDNQNGTRSTLYQSVEQGPDGKYYNVPTVWDGKIETENWTRPADGKVFDVPNAVAKQNIGNAGWASFPSYATPDEADTRYDQMHRYMEKDTNQYQKKKGGSVFDKMKRASK